MSLGWPEILIIIGVLMLLFGATKLPKLARSMGESARIFKAETKGLREDDKAAESSDGTASGEQAKQLPDSTQQQEPLVADTVEETDAQRGKAG